MSTRDSQDDDFDVSFSQNDISQREHCNANDSWENAMGYLMYVANFPTRTNMDSLIHAMEIAFPTMIGKEWTDFQDFRNNMTMFLNYTDRLTDNTQQQLIDRLHFEFSKKVKIWLENGIVEPNTTGVKPRPVGISVNSGSDLTQVQAWQRRQNQSKTMQAAIEKMARKQIREAKLLAPPVVKQRKYRKNEEGKYKKIRFCKIENCDSEAEFGRSYCSEHTKADIPISADIQELLEKYFPQTKKRKPRGENGRFLSEPDDIEEK